MKAGIDQAMEWPLKDKRCREDDNEIPKSILKLLSYGDSESISNKKRVFLLNTFVAHHFVVSKFLAVRGRSLRWKKNTAF